MVSYFVIPHQRVCLSFGFLIDIVFHLSAIKKSIRPCLVLSIFCQCFSVDLTPDHAKIDVFIAKYPSSSNKVVTVFEPASGKNYPNIIKDTPIYNVEVIENSFS